LARRHRTERRPDTNARHKRRVHTTMTAN
jgi:hypothetical protein